MDIDGLASLVLQKFKEGGGHGDVQEKTLLKSIHGALNLMYRKHFFTAQQRISNEEKQGIYVSKEKYEKEYSAVEDMVMNYANKLAATTKEEI